MIMRADEAIPKPLSGPPLQSSPGIAFPWSPLQRLKVAALAKRSSLAIRFWPRPEPSPGQAVVPAPQSLLAKTEQVSCFV